MAMIVGHSQTKYLDSCDECPVFSYSGYSVCDFYDSNLEFYNLVPTRSVIALVIGANDIGRRTATEIVRDIEQLCLRFHAMSPRATVLVSEILPRGRDLFYEQTRDRIAPESVYLEDWNAVASEINYLCRELSSSTDWLQTIRQWEFHTMFGADRRLLGRDGLHLSFEGTEKLADTIMAAIDSVLRKAMSFPSERVLPTSDSTVTIATTTQLEVEKSSVCIEKYERWSKVRKQRRPGQSSASNRARRCQQAVQSALNDRVSAIKKALDNRRYYEVIRNLPSAPISNGRYSLCLNRSTNGTGSTDKTQAQSATSPNRSSSTRPTRRLRTSIFASTKVHLCETTRYYYLNTDELPLTGGGVEPVIFSTTDRKLSYGEASCILESTMKESTTTEPPYRPKEGSVFLYCDNNDLSKKDDWKADGYTWRHNGRKEYKFEGKIIERHFYKIKKSESNQ